MDGDLQNDPAPSPRSSQARGRASLSWLGQGSAGIQKIKPILPRPECTRSLIPSFRAASSRLRVAHLKAYRRHISRREADGEMHRFVPSMPLESGARTDGDPRRKPRAPNSALRYGWNAQKGALLDLLF